MSTIKLEHSRSVLVVGLSDHLDAIDTEILNPYALRNSKAQNKRRRNP